MDKTDAIIDKATEEIRKNTAEIKKQTKEIEATAFKMYLAMVACTTLIIIMMAIT